MPGGLATRAGCSTARMKLVPVIGVALALAGCASVPNSPGVMVLPGSGKSFDTFRVDDAACRQFAYEQVGGKTAERAATESGVKSAVVGTAIGAAAGGLIGGNAGAGVGAGIGLVGGALVGSDAANYSGRTAQQRYDFAFQQCMYAKGHQIPMARRSLPPRQSYSAAPPPPPPPSSPPPSASTPPPPPPGTPPPPPEGYRIIN